MGLVQRPTSGNKQQPRGPNTKTYPIKQNIGHNYQTTRREGMARPHRLFITQPNRQTYQSQIRSSGRRLGHIRRFGVGRAPTYHIAQPTAETEPITQYTPKASKYATLTYMENGPVVIAGSAVRAKVPYALRTPTVAQNYVGSKIPHAPKPRPNTQARLKSPAGTYTPLNPWVVESQHATHDISLDSIGGINTAASAPRAATTRSHNPLLLATHKLNKLKVLGREFNIDVETKSQRISLDPPPVKASAKTGVIDVDYRQRAIRRWPAIGNILSDGSNSVRPDRSSSSSASSSETESPLAPSDTEAGSDPSGSTNHNSLQRALANGAQTINSTALGDNPPALKGNLTYQSVLNYATLCDVV